MNEGIERGAMEIKPMTLAGPIATANTWNKPIKNEAIPAAIIPQINGNFSFKFTPNIAGSVIPNIAETPAVVARLFCFLFFVSSIIAKAAAPYATFAIEATGKIKEPPVLATSASKVVSIAGKL